jgi:hypothetical protein
MGILAMMTLYRGVFAFRSGIEREYAFAKSEKDAKSKLLFRLSKKHDVPIEYVYGLFRDKESYTIEIDKEWLKKQKEANQ